MGIITGWPMGEVRAELGMPVFDKLEVVSGRHEGLKRVVRLVQEQSVQRRTIEGE